MTTRPVIILAALFSVGGSLSAQPTVPGAAAAAPTPWANKLFLANIEADAGQAAPDEIVFDFGTLPKGTLAVHTFVITNIYAVPMQVTDIRRTSETVQAYPPQRVLQANDKAEFVVTLDTSKFTGAGSETVQVSFGPTNVSTATLRVKATSRADIMVAPGSFNFNVVTPGSTPTKVVTIEYAGKQKDWAVTGVVAPTGPFEVTTSAAGRGKTKVSVTLKSQVGNAGGSFNDFVQLQTNDPTSPLINVAVNGTLLAPLTVTPERVNFATVRLGETKTFRVLVRGNGVGPFKLEQVADTGDGLSVQILDDATIIHVVGVNFTPTKVGAFAKEIKLTTNLKGLGTVSLFVAGDVQP